MTDSRLDRRHIAVVFDATDDTMRFFADGVPVSSYSFEAGAVGKLDCTNDELTYIGFGHRQPRSSSHGLQVLAVPG